MESQLTSNPKPSHVLVVGAGMVAARFCETLRELDPKVRITVVGEEPRAPYDRVHLSELFAGKSPSDLEMLPAPWYAENDVELITGQRVVSVDTASLEATTDAGRKLSADRIVLATGSAPFVPPLPGIDKPGFFVYRTVEDVEKIRSWGASCKQGIVIGGGLLGLEAAKALVDLGVETTVVEFAPRLMARQLDEAGSRLLLKSIQALGVNVVLDARSQAIVGEGKVEGLQMADGTVVPAGMVVASAGIRPRDEVARASGVKVGERGAIEVDDHMRTSVAGIWAIGECALHKGMVHGLVAPGYRMAEAAAHDIVGSSRPFPGFVAATKLKLMGVDVASIGDVNAAGDDFDDLVVKAPCAGIYQRVVWRISDRKLQGAVLVGDLEPFGELSALLTSGDPVPADPRALLAPPREEGAGADPIVCNCENVRRSKILQAIDAGATDLAAVKKATKACTGCGSCAQAVTGTIKKRLAERGIQVDRSLCAHFSHSRAELFDLAWKGKIQDFAILMERHGNGGLGCEVCKPVAGNIFASLWSGHVISHGRDALQDSNDRFLANIQKNGTYSVVPRIPAGEITPQKLQVIAEVAGKFDLYTKITGGQRIDLFGARLEQLPLIWKELVDAGFESGHAYAKSVRTVKSCVGSTWCRFGVQDSTGLALAIEERYKGIRSPHKLKFAVSGCARECAEAQSKDVGLIATEKGWNLFVCGNGGMKPRHAELLAQDLSSAEAMSVIDRFLMHYIRTADRLTRTSVWIEDIGGIEELRKVVLDDSLGICTQLEAQMDDLVKGFRCEWKVALEDPKILQRFRAFANDERPNPAIQFVRERGQRIPAGNEQ
ncbi:MAG: nitrite reductase large subunit [Fibrobacteres bacterium]|nr:nitrite reductase large subunit [Fibrobacterota bacterium]QQS04879.1 MAG: nitrite reductase large subunit [Fibrobacterota bacterium]